MQIVILGAGISGCAVYLQLRKHLPKPTNGGEHSITIYEAYDTGQDITHTDRVQDSDIGGSAIHSSTLLVGGGLGVGANGLNVLKRLDEDLLRDFVRGGYVVQKWNMKGKDGSVLARISGSGSSPRSSSRGSAKNAASGESEMAMVGTSRHNLWRCLRVRVPNGDIVTKRVAGVVARPDGLNVVSFLDGSPSVEADLVIGADGLKSTARLALFPDAKEDPYPATYEYVRVTWSRFPLRVTRLTNH
jgi:2-polyprenyl-6-methoxyphenol hydroxylase-like FAD-dependent oxidoreductase